MKFNLNNEEYYCKYWKKYFERKYNIKTLYDLEMFKKNIGVKHTIYWKYLIDLYD